MAEENPLTLRSETATWLSELAYATNELKFLERVLKSVKFAPNTPNLFEHIELFLKGLQNMKLEKERLLDAILSHQGLLNEVQDTFKEEKDQFLWTQHQTLRTRILNYFTGYQEHKQELYEFTSDLII